jgi:uncharacterized protein (TIGR03435 family)
MQTAPAQLTYEVASIKQQDSKDPNGIRGWNCRGFDNPNQNGGPPALLVAMGRCRILRWTLCQTIAPAYMTSQNRVVGCEGWMNSLPYVIEAKADDSLQATRSQLLQMLQNLLTDRFKLKFHRETRQLDGFSLLLRSGSIRLEEVSSIRGGVRTAPGSIEGEATPQLLANALASPLGGPVVDNTGVVARYKVSLKWTPGPGESGYNPNADPGPTIFSVLEDAGLRVVPTKISRDFIVVDSAVKPEL